MKILLSVLAFSLFSHAALAERMTTRITSVEESQDAAYPHLLLLENGRVATVPVGEKNSLIDIHKSLDLGELLEIDVAEDNRLLSIATAAEAEKVEENFLPDPGTSAEFSSTPTNLSSFAEAQMIFDRQNRNHQRKSQCYNRAHVWAFEEWRRSNLQSEKLFVFFTRRYIWDYNYKWWFHVTPMTYVTGYPVTLDRTFDDGPKSVKDWTLRFIKSGRDCRVVYRYSEYSNNQETEHCYLIPATMYNWQPSDLENYELTGVQKLNFIESDVNHAYREAF
jgi:hypothetical protein